MGCLLVADNPLPAPFSIPLACWPILGSVGLWRWEGAFECYPPQNATPTRSVKRPHGGNGLAAFSRGGGGFQNLCPQYMAPRCPTTRGLRLGSKAWRRGAAWGRTDRLRDCILTQQKTPTRVFCASKLKDEMEMKDGGKCQKNIILAQRLCSHLRPQAVKQFLPGGGG